MGTGEALLGPGAAGVGKRCAPITGDPGKWRAAQRESEGVVVPAIRRTTQPAGREAPLLHRCITSARRSRGECRDVG
jgi:hypothetical protein